MSLIIQSGSKQYLVQPNQEVIVDRLVGEEGTMVTLPVLFDTTKPEGQLKEVKAKIVEHFKGEKIRVVKYKAKSNYHKVQGHRSYQTLLQIQS
jgi:large subunit ribosomal protein L21